MNWLGIRARRTCLVALAIGCTSARVFGSEPAQRRDEAPSAASGARGERGSEPPGGSEAARARVALPRGEAAYLRASLEVLGALGLGALKYWSSPETHRPDWDYPRWDELLSSKNVRFDSNRHRTNALMHPLGGGTYYGLSRANGLSVGESVLLAQMASTAWEVLFEWREKISVNDMIFTTAGGTAIGEFFFQLAGYFASAPAPTTWAQDLAAATLGLPVSLHRRLDERPRPLGPEDALGFSSQYHHRFTLDHQVAWLSGRDDRNGVMRGVRVGAEIVHLPGFLTTESFDVAFAEGNFTRGQLAVQLEGSSLAEMSASFDATLAGYYVQRGAEGEVLGALVGVGTGLEYVNRNTLGMPDEIGLAHLAGPRLGLWWRRGALRSYLGARFYADFAAIRSLAWPELRRAAPDERFKSTLDRDYQYHLGLSPQLEARLALDAAFLSAQMRWGRYRSIEGLDRFREEITRDVTGAESLSALRLGFGLEPGVPMLRMYGGVEHLVHRSRLGPHRAERRERRALLGAGMAF